MPFDKLTVISGALFMASNAFAIISLVLPDWIVTDHGGILYINNYYYLAFLKASNLPG